MDKNIKNLLIFLFCVIWIIAIIIGYNKGKKNANRDRSSDNAFSIAGTSDMEKNFDSLLPPKPILFKINDEVFEPYTYKIKIDNIDEKLSIIDEKGNVVEGSQSDKLAFNAFSFNIMDKDIKKEDALKKMIKFDIEKDVQEEHYKGMLDEFDIKDDVKKNKKENKGSDNIKDPEHLIYTN